MIISIKNKLYPGNDFGVENGIATLKIVSTATFAEIVADLALEEGEAITQLNDNEEQIGVYYVQSMGSIQLPGEDGSDIVTIKYHISQLGKEAQEALSDDLDMATLSVLELAGILSTAKHNFSDTATRLETGLTEHDSRITTISNAQNTINTQIARWESMYNALADRVARLENA